MAPITHTIEIDRPPAEVFAYATDVRRWPEWQDDILQVQAQGDGAVRPGARWSTTRKIGPMRQANIIEVTSSNPPSDFEYRGIDGSVRATVRAGIVPLDGGTRSRFNFELALEGHGIGKLLIPLFVRRQIARQVPRTHQQLKAVLEDHRA
jgi:uncharacterized protein YndB with AHSA1/START domain